MSVSVHCALADRFHAACGTVVGALFGQSLFGRAHDLKVCALFRSLDHRRLGHQPSDETHRAASAGGCPRCGRRIRMADEDLDILAPRRGQAILQFVGKHHLCQLALRIGCVRTVALIPVHVIETDGFGAHVVAEAGNYLDPAFAFGDADKEQAIEQKMPVVVGAELAFEPFDGQLARWYLCDGRVIDPCVDARRRWSP